MLLNMIGTEKPKFLGANGLKAFMPGDYLYRIIIPTVRTTRLTINSIASSFPTNLSHVLYSIRALARPPITTPLVGVKRFRIPDAAEKIITITAGL